MFQKRDVYQALKGTFHTVNQLEPALAVLEKHLLIRSVDSQMASPRPGRKPSQQFEVNPKAAETDPNNPQNSGV